MITLILSLILLLTELSSAEIQKRKSLATLCSDDGCDQGFLIPPLYPTTAKIAIIGSGMSGILNARKLAQFGYTDITIYEKDPYVGGYTQSIYIDGQYHDWQAHLIASRFWGSHPHPETVELLKEVPFPFREENIEWHNETSEILPLCLGKIAMGFIQPDGNLNLTSVQIFIQEIIETHNNLSNAFWGQVGEGGPGSIQEPGMDKTWQEYSKTFNPLGTCLHETLLNSANMRYLDQPASFLVNLNSLLQLTLPATVAKMFEKFALVLPQWGNILRMFPSSLRISLLHTKCYAAYMGWNNWMKAILTHLEDGVGPNFNVLTRTAVKRLKGGPKVEIEDEYGRIQYFDVAIITSRPKDTREFVESPTLKELFSEENCPTVWARSVLVQSEFPVEPPIAGNGLGFLIMEPYATLTGTNPKSSINYYTGCNKQNFGDRWVCFANSQGPDEITPEEAWKIVKPQLKEFGFGEATRISEFLSNWPVYPKAGKDWYKKAALLQGVDNVFFGGEVMSGPTIESIIDFVYKSIPYWFTMVQKT